MERKQKLSTQTQEGQSPILKYLLKSAKVIKLYGDSWATDTQLLRLFNARQEPSAHYTQKL